LKEYLKQASGMVTWNKAQFDAGRGVETLHGEAAKMEK